MGGIFWRNTDIERMTPWEGMSQFLTSATAMALWLILALAMFMRYSAFFVAVNMLSTYPKIMKTVCFL